MGKYKIIIAAAIALTMTACADTNTAEDVTLLDVTEDTVLTEETTTISETEATTEETTAELTTVSETSETISETSVTTEAETIKNENTLTVSLSGYVLDPNVTLGENETAYQFAENQPCFIDETSEGVRVYGVNTDTEREFHYIDYAIGEEYFSATSCVIIEHDGIADEFAGFWGERSGSAMSVYSGDFDGDGKNDIASVRYDTGGSFCRIMELVLYKLNNGHYEQFIFSPQVFNNNYIAVDFDSDSGILTVSAKGFDKTFTYDFSENILPETSNFETDLLSVNDFIVNGNEITYIVTPLISVGNGVPETPVDICFKLKFSDGKFACSDVEFTESEY